MLRVLICDDEPLALERLRDLLGRCDDIEIVAASTDGHAAVEQIAACGPDAVFLDIEMPRLDGFDVIERIAQGPATDQMPPLVVFVSAYPRFAVHAFETGALDFLTKPVRFARLELTIARLRQALLDRSGRRRLAELASQIDTLRQERHATAGHDRHLWVQRRGETVRVDLDSLDWIHAEGEYVRLHRGDTSFLHRDLISTVATRVDPARFFRVHRSYIVNGDRIEAIRRTRTGGLTVVLTGGVLIPVGRSYRDTARQFMRR